MEAMQELVRGNIALGLAGRSSDGRARYCVVDLQAMATKDPDCLRRLLAWLPMSGLGNHPHSECSLRQEAGGCELTDKQREILNLISRGYTSREIAGLLGVSYHTVTSHLKHIYARLQVGSRQAAVFEARRLGFLE